MTDVPAKLRKPWSAVARRAVLGDAGSTALPVAEPQTRGFMRLTDSALTRAAHHLQRTHVRLALAYCVLVSAAAALPGCKGCQKEPPAAEPASTLRPPEAAPAPEAATATDAPAASTAVEAPAEATPVQYSVAPAFDSPLPLQAGKLAKLLLTPTANNVPIEAFDPILGQDFIAFVGRPGHDWAQLASVPAGQNKSPTFSVQFTPPSMGNYSIVCVFRPKGLPVVIEQLGISATGDPKVAPMPLSDDLEFTNDAGLKVALRVDSLPAVARKQLQLGTLWTRGERPLALAPAAPVPGSVPGATPTALYFVVDVAEPRVEVPFALADVPSAGGAAPAGRSDAGTLASLTFQRPGQYLVAAVAAAASDNGKLVMATFALNVGDSAPPAAAPGAEAAPIP